MSTATASTQDSKQKFVTYTVEGDEIHREDQNEKVQVAKYDAEKGIVELVEGKENYRPAIIRHLNDKGYRFTEVGFVGMAVSKKELEAEGIPPKPKKNPRLGDKTPAVVEWYARYRPEVFLTKFGVREVQRRVGTETYNRVVRDDDTGKKITIPEQVPIFEKEDTGKKIEFSIQAIKNGEQRLIADCQTHLTVKMSDTENSTEYDWEADATVDQRRPDRAGRI